VTLPAANLFLQGRSYDRPTPRGLTRVNDLARAGVTVACASDNIQDPFVPTGSGDLLEIARWTMLAAHLASTELARAFDMATRHPARLMGLAADHGIKVGRVPTGCHRCPRRRRSGGDWPARRTVASSAGRWQGPGTDPALGKHVG
jgi:cytosine/adenosine deaminase-related metal-dependent hydrolase